MIDLDTPFRAKARRLRPPTGANFDSAVWKRSYAGAANKTEADQELFRTTIWIATQSEALRRNFIVDGLKELGSRLSVILGIAMINRDFTIAAKLSGKVWAQAHERGAVALDYLVAQPFADGAGRKSEPSSFTDTIVDVAEAWLFDAYSEPPDVEHAPSNLAPIAVRAARRYSLQHILNARWREALWEGWYLNSENNAPLWVPGDRQLATLIEAWRLRQEANFMSFVWVDMSAWALIPPDARRKRAMRTVLEVKPGKRLKTKIGRPPCLSNRMPGILAEQAGFEGSYLLQFLDMPFPLDQRLTCRLLSRAWHVIADLGMRMRKPVLEQGSLNEAEARALALLVGRRELAEILMRALGEDKDTANALIDFLSFRPKSSGDKGHRGLWAAPLVPIPGEERLALALPSLCTSNPLRKAEAWLEKGGLDDRQSKDTRGGHFEAELRRQVKQRLAKNQLLSDARCAEHAIKKDSTFGEEIDLLIQIGSLLLIGEVKFHLTPADSHERYNHLRKLQAAAEQARRKATLLVTRPDVIARALDITETRAKELRAVPLIVDNQGFGFSLDLDGCRVSDSRYLLNCLGSGKLVTHGAINPRTGKYVNQETAFYSSQAEAERDFEQLLACPSVLTRFTRRIEWGRSTLPTASGIQVAVEVPLLKDITGEDLERIQALQALIDPPHE